MPSASISGFKNWSNGAALNGSDWSSRNTIACGATGYVGALRFTLGQAAKLCEGLEARQPFSANRAVVKDTRDFAGQLLAYMVKTGQVEKKGAEYFPVENKKRRS